MRKIIFKDRRNEGYNNYPDEKTITVDDKLYEIMLLIQDGNASSAQTPEGSIYIRKTPGMTQDKGFEWVNLSTKEHGCSQGMFYCGIPKDAEYVDFSRVCDGGEYHYKDLLKTY